MRRQITKRPELARAAPAVRPQHGRGPLLDERRKAAGNLSREDLKAWMRSWSLSVEQAEKIIGRSLNKSLGTKAYLTGPISDRLKLVRCRSRDEVMHEVGLEP